MGLSGKHGTCKKNGAEFAEIISFDLNNEAYEKAYGHNLSKGCQDLVYGIEKWTGTITVNLRRKKIQFKAGKIYELKLFPWGKGGSSIGGKAGIPSAAISVKLENGEPVSATYKFSSKLKWKKTPGTGGGSGSGSSGSGSGSSGSGSGSSGSGSSGS